MMIAPNSIVVLGPTACGKTSLAVRIALSTGCEIISADSRQVYRGLDIGSGKDLNEYTVNGVSIPYHLIDVTDLSREYSVFDFQRDAYRAFSDILQKKKIPLIAGGTGMYLDCLIRGYDFVEVPVNQELRESLRGKSMEELLEKLSVLKGGALHNSTDITERHRLIRAIEIETFTQSEHGKAVKANMARPDIRPLALGIFFPRETIKKRIAARLRERFRQGMIDEVQRLHEQGASWERLERLGLEYRYIALFLQKKISCEDELFKTLYTAITHFAKRQETWFRGMEKKGVVIYKIYPEKEDSFESTMTIIHEHFGLLQ